MDAETGVRSVSWRSAYALGTVGLEAGVGRGGGGGGRVHAGEQSPSIPSSLANRRRRVHLLADVLACTVVKRRSASWVPLLPRVSHRRNGP